MILVTGGTRGIGSAIASQLRGRGHRVYVTQRAPVEGEPQSGLDVLNLDITSAASVEACVGELLRREGHLDVLINNAGYDLFGAVLETQWHEFMDQLDTNFLGAARMVQAVLPHMLERRSGRIINISSIGGEVGLPMNAAYSASKFALEGYTESLRQELMPLGLYACTVSPSPVATGSLEQSIREVSAADNPFAGRRAELVRRMRRDGLMSRTRPEHVAAAVAQAVHAQVPAPRYRVGSLARWIPRLKGWLPDSLFEQFMRRTFP
ncbi:SDR family NAD(P)-dependent oxidoreductase [Dyella soli]|uniref:SDR family NAD(P)-dependent oxidoreductase n=1 Tax=Dyella soli TaxID=522319 RepID=UPI001F10205B|nr:SDR family NAD(P)-dependent oxidoreductase [Dyella soli]